MGVASLQRQLSGKEMGRNGAASDYIGLNCPLIASATLPSGGITHFSILSRPGQADARRGTLRFNLGKV